MRNPGESEGPWVDPIVVEVRAERLTLSEATGFDLDEFGRQVRARQRESEREVISLLQWPPRQRGGKAV